MNILHLITSPRKDASISVKLGNAIIEKLLERDATNTVKIRNLSEDLPSHLNDLHIRSFFTPDGQRTPELLEAARYSGTLIDELLDADVVVIGVPMYNFTIPSTLKAWIDQVARVGRTFTNGADGFEGLVKDKKVYLAIATGQVYSSGPFTHHDFTEKYLRIILGFIGITDISAYRAEGLHTADHQDTALDKAIASIIV